MPPANQPFLQSALQERFCLAQRDALQEAGRYAQCAEQSHGRFTWRGFWVTPNAGEVDTERWPDCRILGMIESLHKVGDEELPPLPEAHYYLYANSA